MIRRLVLVCALGAAVASCGERFQTAALPAEAPRELDGGIARYDLRFPCGATECAGWLYLPNDVESPPVVVMGHGFAGTRDVGLPFFAEFFARAGVAAFVFDYRNFGSSGGAPRQLVDPWQQLDDWAAAIALVRSHYKVDGSRVALWGSSLGGGHALIAAARDGDVKAVVAQVPLIDSEVEGEATFPGALWLIRLLLTAWGDLACSAFSGDSWLIPAIAPNSGFGIIVDDSAFERAIDLVPLSSRYRNEVAARSVLTFDDYNPLRQAAALTAPVLLIASKADRFAPYAAVEAYAKAYADVTVSTIEGDHFDVYTRPVARHAAEEALSFLKSHLEPQLDE
jgi:pimeloyl-ACP methyl ester carboxylesterase